MLLKGVTINFMGEILCENIFINYTSLTMLGAAIFLFIGFKKLELSQTVKKCIALISPLAFSVYLIHINPLVRDNLLSNSFSEQATLEPLGFVAFITISAAVICIACYTVDTIRELLFRALKINKIVNILEERLIGSIWGK